MVIVARFFFGSGSGIAAVVTLTYTGEMSTRMDEIRERKGKKPRKFVLYIIYSLEVTGSYVLSFSEFLLTLSEVVHRIVYVYNIMRLIHPSRHHFNYGTV